MPNSYVLTDPWSGAGGLLFLRLGKTLAFGVLNLVLVLILSLVLCVFLQK